MLGLVIDKIPDNIMAQRLLADSNLAMGYLKESLESYKMLLYFNPCRPGGGGHRRRKLSRPRSYEERRAAADR